MILPPEKAQALFNGTDGEGRETEIPQYQSESDSAPSTFPTPEKAPLTHLEYHPESSSSSRAIATPTFPPPAGPPPPSYSNDLTRPANPSYFAQTSSTNENAMSFPGTSSTPVSFTRVPPRDAMYPGFPPMFLIATGKTLDKGFPLTSPPSNSNPHPFASHDVYENDWLTFLSEVKTMATLTEKQIRMSHLPIISIIPIVNELSFYGVKQYLKHRNTSKVVDCIDKWNRHFFEQRKIKIVLMKGQVKVSGQKEYPNHTSPSSPTSNHKSDDYQDHRPPPSAAGISQELLGINDDIYRLFVVPLL